MIFQSVPEGVEIVLPGHSPTMPTSRPLRVSKYAEFMGGLGDMVLRMYDWDLYSQFEQLGPGETGAVVLMVHNPYAWELFAWHPKRDQLMVFDYGFKTAYHPWENTQWRISRGIPPHSPHPSGGPQAALKFYPSPEAQVILDQLYAGGPYVVFGATAGTPERSIPEPQREEIAEILLKAGHRIVVVGSSRYFKGERRWDLRPRPGIIDLTDKLTVPGMATAISHAAGVVTAHTCTLHLGWRMNRPVFLLYDRWHKETTLPLGPVGYMAGINQPTTDHMEFPEYRPERVTRWLRHL